MRITYANVMSTIAVFLLIAGGTAIAASKVAKKSVGPGQLKASAVTAAKIKKNAVTGAKIKAGAVSGLKIADGSVGFADLAPGTNLIASAATGPLGNLTEIPFNAPFSPPIAITAQPGVLYMAHFETRGNLARKGTSRCDVEVLPRLNGQAWRVGGGSGAMVVETESQGEGTDFPVPVASASAPLGLNGGKQEVSLMVQGDGDCATSSTVNVSIVLTQQK
jgi:hypothetical protein